MNNTSLNRCGSRLARAVALVLALAAHQAQAVSYSFSDLGTTAASEIYSLGGINNAGQVVATRYTSDFSSSVPAVWSGGNWAALNAFGSGVYHDGNAINNNGQVGGNSYDTTPGVDTATPIVWTGTTPAPLSRLNTTDSYYADVLTLNDNSQGAGGAFHGSGFVPVRWDGTNIVQLPTLGGSAGIAWDINNSGQAVGRANTTNDDAVHPAFWSADGTVTDLGTLGGSVDDTAWSINDSGQIVGHSFLADNVTNRPVLWNNSSSAPTDLGTLSGTLDGVGLAGAINNLGQIFGYSSYDPTDPRKTAMTLWDHGAIINLNLFLPADLAAAGWTMSPGSTGLNDAGVIVGSLSNSALGQSGIFMLTPTAVPIPAAVWLFGSALAGMGIIGRRKQAAA